MKYFELKRNNQFRDVPSLINWYGSFDVRNIKIDSFYKIPQRQLFQVEMKEGKPFSDLIFHPFLLVSSTIRDLIKTYGDTCFFREIILLL